MQGKLLEFRGHRVFVPDHVPMADVQQAILQQLVGGLNGRDGADGLPGANGRHGLDGRHGVDGAPGLNGKDGVDGRHGVPGIDGRDGVDGVGIATISQPDEDTMVIELTNRARHEIKLPKGRDGKDGVDGQGRTVVVNRFVENPSVDSPGSVLFAGVDLFAYRLVTTNESGLAVYADCSVARYVDQVMGLTPRSIPAGETFSVVERGVLQNAGWNWIPGEPLFLGLEGEVTRDPYLGVFVLQVGYAKSPTELFVRIGRGILRAT